MPSGGSYYLRPIFGQTKFKKIGLFTELLTQTPTNHHETAYKMTKQNAAITKMIVDQNDANIVYALTGKSRFRCSEPRLYKSINGGSNWVQVAVNEGDILDFDLHPTNNDILFVSTFEANTCSSPLWQYVSGNEFSGAFYKSTDGGATFGETGSETGFISVGLNPDEISITNFLFPIKLECLSSSL